MKPTVPNPNETVKQFTKAKENLLKYIKTIYAHTHKAFDRYMQKIYSANYNKEAAERIRQKFWQEMKAGSQKSNIYQKKSFKVI
jgi:hypothetical protein